MPDLDDTIRDNHAAVAEFITLASTIPPERWDSARPGGKWSRAQLVEHVRLVYQMCLSVTDQSYHGLVFPGLVRSLFRRFFFQPVLKRGAFKPGIRGPRIFAPAATPGSRQQLLSSLQAASDGLEQSLAWIQQSGRAEILHPFFGTLPLTDFLRFQAIHTRHHLAQLGE